MTESTPTKVAIPVADTTVTAVTVFNDRAEVTRSLTLPAEAWAVGVTELCVEGLTSRCDPDSVRVKAVAGTGLTIMEVAFEVHQKVVKDEGGEGAVETKRAEMKALTRRRDAKAAELRRVNERAALVDGYVKGMLAPSAPQPAAAGGPPVGRLQVAPAAGHDLAVVGKLLEFAGTNGAQLDAERLQAEEDLASLNAELEVLAAALKRLEAPVASRTVQSRDVSVLVQASEASAKGARPAAALHLTYMVTHASWSPSYDIRVDATKGSGELSLSYLGLVMNASGEDWPACSLSLSTARPSKAGMPPAPPRKMIRWADDRPRGHGAVRSGPGVWGSAPRPGAMPMQACMAPQQACMTSNMCMAGPPQSLMAGPRLERQLSINASEAMMDDDLFGNDDGDDVATTTVSEGGGGTATFAIERTVTIESDNKPHRVTIALLNFTPQLLYFATPSIEPSFYLQVKAKNTSAFPLLASRKVSVFLDGSFVTTTQLKDVSPSEDFTTFLGVDAALKIEHQTLAREHKAAGWASKQQSTTHRFRSKLHNTKAAPVAVTVVEVLPKSSEDKIKVELTAPASKELTDSSVSTPAGGGTVQQNKVTNNVVWQLTLKPGEKRELPFEYCVTWPNEKKLDFYELAA